MRLETMQASVLRPPIPTLHGRLPHALGDADDGPVRTCVVSAPSLIDAGRFDRPPKSSGRGPTLAPWRVRRVTRQLAERISGPLRVEDLSAATGLTTGYFSKAFRGAFGISPHAYLIELRITRACELMLQTDQPLAQIALACGLCDQAHLSRLFRQRHGLAPAAWRRVQLSAPAGTRRPQPHRRKS